jgi:hypothetical protein
MAVDVDCLTSFSFDEQGLNVDSEGIAPVHLRCLLVCPGASTVPSSMLIRDHCHHMNEKKEC